MKKYIYSLILFTILMLPALASNYVVIDKSEKMFLDTNSLTNYQNIYGRKNLKSLWAKSLNQGSESDKNIEKILNKKFWYHKNQYIIDCEKREIAVRFYQYYDLEEHPIINQTYPTPDGLLKWNPIIPETVGETIYTFSCIVN